MRVFLSLYKQGCFKFLQVRLFKAHISLSVSVAMPGGDWRHFPLVLGRVDFVFCSNSTRKGQGKGNVLIM